MLHRRLRLLLVLSLFATLFAAAPTTAVPLAQSADAPPVTITKVGSYKTLQHAYRVQATGDRAFVDVAGRGLEIIDVSNPISPTLYATYNPGYCCRPFYDAKVEGSLLYKGSGFQIVDMTDPRSPAVLGVLPNFGGMRVYVADGFAYLANNNKLQIIDVHNPQHPVACGTTSEFISVYNMQLVGNLLFVDGYINSAYSGFYVVDVTNVDNPVVRGSIYCSYCSYGDISIVNDVAYVPVSYCNQGGCSRGTIKAIDIRDPDKPTPLGEATLSGIPTNLVISGSLAYVTSKTYPRESPPTNLKIQLLDINDLTTPRILASYEGLTSLDNFQLVGNRIYVADGDAGLQILEVNFPYSVFLPSIAR